MSFKTFHHHIEKSTGKDINVKIIVTQHVNSDKCSIEAYTNEPKYYYIQESYSGNFNQIVYGL